MKRVLLFATIFLATLGTSTAQNRYDLSARAVEPARTAILPYNNMTLAQSAASDKSRFVAQIEEFTVSEGGSATTFTTYFAQPVEWLNRQLILRIGYASSAYTVYVNGHEVAYTPSGAMGAEFNITKAAIEGRNEVSIMLDKALLPNKLYKSERAIVEGVEVFTQPTIRIRDAVSKLVINNGSAIAEFAIPVKCNALNRKAMRLHYKLRLGETTTLAEGYREMELDMLREDTIRFACIVPNEALWNAKNPTLLRLELESRIENRISECYALNVGVRQLSIVDGALHINNEKAAINLVEWETIKDINKVAKKGYNGIIITLDRNAKGIIEECAKRGLYVVVRTPIDTTELGDHIRRGGNPSNDPMWGESYLWSNLHALNTTKSNCAVIGYEIAKGYTSGINIYETYLLLKSLAPHHLIIYKGAEGEWATDKL